jgi:hypothetical protein
MVSIIHEGYNSAKIQGNVVDVIEYFNNLIRVSRFQFSYTSDNFNKIPDKQFQRNICVNSYYSQFKKTSNVKRAQYTKGYVLFKVKGVVSYYPENVQFHFSYVNFTEHII